MNFVVFYHLQSAPSVSCAVVTSLNLLHKWLGHPSLSKSQKMVPGFGKIKVLNCESCQLGKQVRSYPGNV